MTLQVKHFKAASPSFTTFPGVPCQPYPVPTYPHISSNIADDKNSLTNLIGKMCSLDQKPKCPISANHNQNDIPAIEDTAYRLQYLIPDQGSTKCRLLITLYILGVIEQQLWERGDLRAACNGLATSSRHQSSITMLSNHYSSPYNQPGPGNGVIVQGRHRYTPINHFHCHFFSPGVLKIKIPGRFT